MFVSIVLVIIVAIAWYFISRPSDSSTNFLKEGGHVAQVEISKEKFTTDYFTVLLPSGWKSMGLQHPRSDSTFYEYQSTAQGYDNRRLQIFVDNFPKNYAVNRLLPIDVVDNKIVTGVMSDDCATFTGAPTPGSTTHITAETWTAKWQGVVFLCAMNKPENLVGTASEDEGYGVTLINPKGLKHKYFFVYIDQNVRPDYTILSNALKSFETL